MRVALVADIHANQAAFEAVVASIERERPGAVLCLGDVASTGPQVRETLGLLKTLGWPTVMGNADADLIEAPARPPFVDGIATADDAGRIADIDRWCAALLDDADRSYIRTFQPTISIDLGGAARLLAFHGSPRSFNEVISASTADEVLDQLLEGHGANLFAGGHWHFRMLRTHQTKTVLNPGSAGLAYEFRGDGSVRVPPWAEFALVDVGAGGEVSVRFNRVLYDREATIRAMFERGMPHASWWSADWR